MRVAANAGATPTFKLYEDAAAWYYRTYPAARDKSLGLGDSGMFKEHGMAAGLLTYPLAGEEIKVVLFSEARLPYDVLIGVQIPQRYTAAEASVLESGMNEFSLDPTVNMPELGVR